MKIGCFHFPQMRCINNTLLIKLMFGFYVLLLFDLEFCNGYASECLCQKVVTVFLFYLPIFSCFSVYIIIRKIEVFEPSDNLNIYNFVCNKIENTFQVMPHYLLAAMNQEKNPITSMSSSYNIVPSYTF